MSLPRFKVWTIDPDGEPGTLLIHTGASPISGHDFSFAGDNPYEVARFACIVNALSVPVWLLVKNFDTDEWFIVGVEPPDSGFGG